MRKEHESFTIYNKKTGNRFQNKTGFYIGYYDDCEEAKKVCKSLNDSDAVVCIKEIYTYFDNDGVFQKREEYISPLY